ncbi:MobF family relaxase [Nocardia macrotermitis]|uniref:ATP-dependent RecD-like DNA helicase n=1 Tax=Nocardia macrotermitis TaxID=2585198 RepID=A0A7K0DEZ2_9NOCA|nr:MobF family relaxase [Nocardia macrotermitis]MQY24360.1 ATP-dependent RecD-like DNA helicase [Nocardia macrotermitis]
MTATIHKLSAGDGFLYYIRQTAAHDASNRGRNTLADYYSAKGESPGVWMGSGLSAFESIDAGDTVTEAQMRAIFGLGRHPDAEAIEDRVFAEQLAAGAKPKDARRAALAASQLGQPFRIYSKVSEFRRRCAQEYTLHNVDRGYRWNAAIDDDVRAQIRTRVARELFVAELDREPLNDAELSGWVARNSHDPTTAISGFDLCLAGVKSESVFRALAPQPLAELAAKADRLAVADTIAFLESHAAYTRLGANGVAQVDTDGLIITAFEHRDSRAGDPHFHTHLVISGKVRSRAGGLWRALDARMLYRFTVAASEVYNTSRELHWQELLGVEYADRDDGAPDRRPVREIVGADHDLLRLWSRRDAEIDVRLGELAREFQHRWGREPTTVEMLRLSQIASRETRPPKHEPRALAEQRATWWSEAADHLGGDSALADMVWAMCNPTVASRPEPTSEWIAAVADRVIAAVSLKRSVWQSNHIHAEVQRQLHGQVTTEQWKTVADAVLAQAMAAPRSISRTRPDLFDEPEPTQRVDGSSVFTVAESQQYTSAAVLIAEQQLVAAARRTGGPTVSNETVDVALLEYSANNNGRELTAGQAALVREFATSGRALQVAIAPAGTGKTVAMQVLVRAWLSEGGTMLGLAPTARAAAILHDDIAADVPVDTIDRLVYLLTNLTPENAAHYPVPRWVHSIGPGTLVVIDEAAKASTRQLDLVVEFVTRRGGVVRMIGDDRQLSSITAGGALRDIVETAGASTLTQVMRFVGDPAEAAATLAVRAGDPAAIAFYTDRGRVHIGALDTVIDAAYTAWANDRAAGSDSVMLAMTREIVAVLNHRARTERLATITEIGPEVQLSDGLKASAGELICTRRNMSKLRISSTDYVRNGYRWIVETVHPDGSLTATHTDSGCRVRIPADYLSTDVTLGYASTLDSAQGITVDTSHNVFTGAENRAQLYVAISRGRRRNDIYVQTAIDLDHAQFSDRAAHPPTVVDLLTDILSREDGRRSATTTHRETFAPTTRLNNAADAYSHAVTTAAEYLAGPEVLERIDTGAEDLMPGLTEAGAWPVLRGHLAVIAISPGPDGQPRDPVAELAATIAERDFDDVIDPAAVLDWRLDSSGHHSCGEGPLPWLLGTPEVLDQDPIFGKYLAARRRLITTLATNVSSTAISWTAATAPEWARPLLAATCGDPRLIADLAVWRAVRRIDDTDRQPTGPELPKFGAARAYQDALLARLEAQLGAIDDALGKWIEAVEQVDPRVVSDAYWPVLAERLDLAQHAGFDVPDLLRTAAERGPLPDEQPAAALWWRLAEHLDPGVLDDAASHDRLRPNWITDIEDILAPSIAAFLVSDPGWPQLVAAVDTADPTRWTPRELLLAAYHLITENAEPDQLPRPDQWAIALAWRITALNRHHRVQDRVPPPDSPEHIPEEDEEAAARADRTLHPDPGDDPAAAAALFDPPDHRTAVLADENSDEYWASLTSVADTGSERDLFRDSEADDFETYSPPVDPLSIPEHRDLPMPERIALLRTEYLEYAQTYHNLLHACTTNSGRHLRAIESHLSDLRARREAQYHYLLAARTAHTDWIEADRDAAHWQSKVTELTRHIHQQSGNTPDLDDLDHFLTGITDPTAHAHFATQIAALRTNPVSPADQLELHLAQICADSATTAANQAQAHAEATHQALLAAAGPQGVVTSDDVETTRMTAIDLDFAELNAARFRFHWKEAQLLRSGIEKADLPSLSDDALVGPERSQVDSSTGRSPQSPSAPTESAQNDSHLSTLTDVELQDHIQELHTHLSLANATDAVLFRWTRPETLDSTLSIQHLAADKARHQQQLADAHAEQQRRQRLSTDQTTADHRRGGQLADERPSPQNQMAQDLGWEHPEPAEAHGLE